MGLQVDEIGLSDLRHLNKLRGVNQQEEEISSSLPADLDSLPRLQGFRLRGIEMTRLETFIDAASAFAFAVTMLVIARARTWSVRNVTPP